MKDAAAFLQAGLYEDAKQKLQEAQKLDSNNEKVKDALTLISVEDWEGAQKLLEK